MFSLFTFDRTSFLISPKSTKPPLVIGLTANLDSPPPNPPVGSWIAPHFGAIFGAFKRPRTLFHIPDPAHRFVREYPNSIEPVSKNRKFTRVLLIGDHAAVRAGLRMLIESRPGLRVVGEVENCVDAAGAVALEKPDVVLLGLGFCPPDQCLDLLPELLAASRQSRIILLTSIRDTETLHRAMELGAMGFVHWERAAAELVKAIEKVHAGEAWLDRSLTARMITRRSRFIENKNISAKNNKISLLTGREREVGALVAEGLRNKEIANRLFISETTVRHHLTSIFSKLEVSNRLELIVFLHNVATPQVGTRNNYSVGRVN